MIEIRVEGISEALRALNIDIDALAREIGETVADEAVLPRLREYPDQSGKKQPFVSAKQRRFFFAALRRGQITVPYRRSRKLRDSWHKVPFRSGAAVASTGVGYTDLVVTKGEQAKYHQGNWWTTESVAADVEREEAQGIAERVATAFIAKSGAGP